MFSEDLEADGERWSEFAPAAVQQGFRSMQALPMRVRGETIGAMNLVCSQTGGIAEPDLSLGQGMFAERCEIDVDAAFVRMRAHARDNIRRVQRRRGRSDRPPAGPRRARGCRDGPSPPSAR